MRYKRRMSIKFFVFFFLTAIPAFAGNSQFTVMSHRGMYQNYSRDGLTPETCTAEIIFPPTHSYLENTIPSMLKAFELNADSVELDVHSTTDGKIVVFHDWTLECRTNGKGVIQEQTFDYLRSLDIGYGYTADGHKTHPFRCQVTDQECLKRNQMPTLREVLAAFPNQKFVINMKSRSSFTLETLVKELRSIQQEQKYNLRNLFFFCNDQATNNRMRALMPEIETPKLTWEGVNACWVAYFRTKGFPENCRGTYLAYPADEFQRRGKEVAAKMVADVHGVGSKFWVVRVDDAEAFKYVSQFEIDGIWTDHIDVIGPLVSFDRVDADLKVYEATVAKMKSDFGAVPANPQDREWVKKKLAHMVAVDQFMRKFPAVIYEKKYTDKEMKFFWSKFMEKFRTVDLENTVDLKALLVIHGWFRISVFGEKADDNAWLLVQHADHDPQFQSEILVQLEALSKIGETQPGHYAYLFDRVAASWNDLSKRKLQRYGTQGTCVGPQKWEPIPMEDPANVDVRRASVGLGTMAEYLEMFKDVCK